MKKQKTREWVKYVVYGDLATARNVLLLVHGRGMSGDQFWKVAPQCVTDTLAVVAIDLPGHGQSDIPSGWSLGAFAQAIHTLMTQELQIKRFDLFGHSLGGVIALEYVKRYPTHVRTLIIMGTHLEIESIPRMMIWLDYGIRRVLGNSVLYSWYIFLVWCLGDSTTYDFLKSVWCVAGGHNVSRDLAIVRQISRYDYRLDLAEFEREGGRVCMVVCSYDWLINLGLKKSLDFMSDQQSRRVEFISGGHYSHCVNGDELVRTLKKFLT